MEDNRIVNRGDNKFLRMNVGYSGDGAGNILEEENGKRTLFLDYCEFIAGVYWVMPHWSPKDGEPLVKTIREKLSAVRLITFPRTNPDEHHKKQIPITLNKHAVLIHHPHFLEILVPVSHFSHQVFKILNNKTVKSIDLRVMVYEFSLAFEKRWKSLVLKELRDAA
ncbi:MAG: hypothetical protein ABSF47_01510 [Minisyncoccia bacterium]|jgi:hypothetical protein